MLFHIFILVLCCDAHKFKIDVPSHKADQCNDQWKMIGECETKIHVCAGFYDWEWKYYGHAETNGFIGPKTTHYDSQDGAGYHAVYLLFQSLPSGSCNCGYVNNYAVAKCDMNIEACFNFNTSADVEHKKPSYFAWVRPVNVTDIFGYYCCKYSQNVTVEYAIKDLYRKDTPCFV